MGRGEYDSTPSTTATWKACPRGLTLTQFLGSAIPLAPSLRFARRGAPLKLQSKISVVFPTPRAALHASAIVLRADDETQCRPSVVCAHFVRT